MTLWPRKAPALLALLFMFVLAIFLTTFSSRNGSGTPVAAAADDWPTLAADPQRTSYTSTEVSGRLNVEWYRQFDAYIPERVQIIATNGLLYISTANGLYAINAVTGNEAWVYPTAMPLGHSPTIANGVAYVAGLDKKVHAINANTGAVRSTFEAEAGFETNPLVVGNRLYIGSRDGTFYALNISNPGNIRLDWTYETGGPILFSAAYQANVNIGGSIKDLVFFAANDSYAYALNADTGALEWRSAKLPGQGFYSYWPVVYEDKVIFSGSSAYGTIINWSGRQQIQNLELEELFNGLSNNALIGSQGTVSGAWAPGTVTINASRIRNYLIDKPFRKSVFVLNQTNGQENSNSLAPLLFGGTKSGNRYPPVIGSDGVLYQQNIYHNDPSIAWGQVSGWVPGSGVITGISSDHGASDEPHAAAAGGDLIYWNLCCDRQSGVIDITKPNTAFPDNLLSNRELRYYGYDLHERAPGYNSSSYSAHTIYTKPYATWGGVNGVYGFHGDVNPPIPYNGRVYIHRSNTLISLAPDVSSPTQKPNSTIRAVPEMDEAVPGEEWVKEELAAEIQAMLDAGHLRPGYFSHGLLDGNQDNNCGDTLTEYFSNSAETIYTLLQALPYLPTAMRAPVRAYIQNEYNNFPPYQYNHIGWRDGAAREAFILPQDIAAELGRAGPSTKNFTLEANGGWNSEGGWGRNPFTYYALWKYAAEFGNASAVYSASQSAFWDEFNDQPSDAFLRNMPLMHNAYIAGYIGFLELQALAGQPKSQNLQNELNRLLQLRANTFTKNTSYLLNRGEVYCRTFNISSNFMYLVPELAEYLRQNALSDVNAAVSEYESVAPYWFVTFFTGGFAENAIVPLQDAHSLFMAKGMIQDIEGVELIPYLDVPGFARGDLYYLQKLLLLLEQGIDGYHVAVSPGVQSVAEGDAASFRFTVTETGIFDQPVSISVNNPHSMVSVSTYPSSVTPTESFNITLTDLHTPGALGEAAALYPVTVTFMADDIVRQMQIYLLVNGEQVFMPVMTR
jgi:outer membrane protein assembly factor BamB